MDAAAASAVEPDNKTLWEDAASIGMFLRFGIQLVFRVFELGWRTPNSAWVFAVLQVAPCPVEQNRSSVQPPLSHVPCIVQTSLLSPYVMHSHNASLNLPAIPSDAEF